MTDLLLSEGVEKLGGLSFGKVMRGQFIIGLSITVTYLLLSEGVENSLLLGSLWQPR